MSYSLPAEQQCPKMRIFSDIVSAVQSSPFMVPPATPQQPSVIDTTLSIVLRSMHLHARVVETEVASAASAMLKKRMVGGWLVVRVKIGEKMWLSSDLSRNDS